MKEAAAQVLGPIQEARKMWGWYLALGIASIVLGCYAIYAEWAATLASIIVLGAIILASGIAQIVAAFMSRNAGHIILLLLVGALDILVGLMLMEHSEFGAVVVTLFLAVVFVFSGIYRIIAALWLQFPQYGWVVFSGVVSVALGILLWMQWPASSLWFIGFAVGINLIFAGVAWSSFALKLKSA